MSIRNLLIISALCLPLLSLLTAEASAVIVGVTQSGADSDEVMLGRTFTIEASGWTGECTTAQVSFSGCSSCALSGEDAMKTLGGASSVSWTTVSASQKASAQSITVSLSGGCTLQQQTSDSFDIVLPPSLDLTASTEASTIDKGDSFSVNINIVNSGETTANTLVISSATEYFTADCAPISSVDEGNSAGESCSVTASSSQVSGEKTVSLQVTSANADSDTDTLSVTVNPKSGDGICDPGETGTSDCPGGQTPGGTGPTGPSFGGPPALNRTKTHTLVPGVGLRNNTKLQAAIEKVLAKGMLSEQARENLLRLSASIASELSTTRVFNVSGSKSRITTRMRYSGQNKTRNFMLYESVPKTFANSTSLVTVTAPGARVEVAEADPSWIFLYPEINTGQEIIITYEVTGQKASTVLDGMTSEVYAESMEEPGVTPPAGQVCTAGAKRCSGSALQQCSSDGTNWVTLQDCQHGCDSASLTCKSPAGAEPGAGVPGGLAFDTTTTMIIAGVIIAVLAAAVVIYLKKMRKPARKVSVLQTVKKDLGQKEMQSAETV